MPAIPYFKTGTKSTSWDAGENEKNLKSDEADLRKCFAWVDPSGNADAKASYKFPHHFVSDDGAVGDASTKACQSAIAVLNGGMGGADIPDGDKQGVYDHVSHHLKDAGLTPAELKSAPTPGELRAAALHDPMHGTHMHPHSAMGSQGGDETHSHQHTHDGDADHGHSHDEAKSHTHNHSGRSLTKSVERRQRSVAGIELRSGKTAGTKTLSGYACVTGSPYTVYDWLGEFQETVSRGAFAKTLAEQDDVRLLFNHDGIPLARTKSGTLTLEEDEKGLRCEAELDDASPLVQQVSSAMNRGDLDQMSFAFQVMRQEWNGDFSQRFINEAKLFDVSVVTYPANPATSASLRSLRAQSPQVQMRLAVLSKQLREGKTFSAENQKQLTDLLDALAQIDELTDEWQPKLADLLGVKNPDADDDDDKDEKKSSVPLSLVRAQLEMLKL